MKFSLRTTIGGLLLTTLLALLPAQLFAASLTDRFPEEQARARALLDPQCWTRLTCEAAGGELDNEGKDSCASALLPQGDPSFDVGYCNITRIGSGKVKLNIPLPGLSEVENIGQWIRQIYIFTIAFGIIIAIIVTMHSGLLYVTSSGNPEMIQTAKKKITNAFVGLILLLGSYTLLNTINPDLVNLRPPTIKKFRTATEIHTHVLENLAGGDLGKKVPTCETDWVMRLRGYLIDEQDDHDFTYPSPSELSDPNNKHKYDRLNISCGMLIPTGRSDKSICMATYCNDSETVCVLLTDPATGNISLEKTEKGSACVEPSGEAPFLVEKIGGGKPLKINSLDDADACGALDGTSQVGTQCLTVDTQAGSIASSLASGGGTTCYIITGGALASLVAPENGPHGLKVRTLNDVPYISSKTPGTGKYMRCEPDLPR